MDSSRGFHVVACIDAHAGPEALTQIVLVGICLLLRRGAGQALAIDIVSFDTAKAARLAWRLDRGKQRSIRYPRAMRLVLLFR